VSEKTGDAKALKVARSLKNADNWKHLARWNGEGYYALRTEDTGDVPVRMFLTPKLLKETEDIIYRQIVNATRFPGVKLVVITPDTHYGYGVPVGCVILTDARSGAVAMGPVGYDIGCFTADTLVPTVDGHSYPIGELSQSGEGVFVYALSSEHRVVVAKATAKKTRTNASLVKVTLDNGREIHCTPDHEFMLRDGSYCEAQKLRPGTSLMPFDSRISKGGYALVRHPATGMNQRVHWVMARSGLLGEIPSFKGQRRIIHHKNFNPGDNRLENLESYLVAYNQSEAGRAKSSEVAHRVQTCETCGKEVPGRGFGIHNHQNSRHGYNHKVVSVESLNQVADVYCLNVPEYGNFAIDAGVFVHNCGMVSAKSDVPADSATFDKKLAFNSAVMQKVNMGAGGRSVKLGKLNRTEFYNLVRGGAEYYVEKYGATFDRSRAERHRLPVDDDWQPPLGGKGRPERGMEQLGSLGGGNHFIELQRCEETGTLFVQAHTGSRGWGHGLATNYFEMAKAEKPHLITDIDLGYFTPESEHYRDYLNAVAAGGNFAIINRLIIFEQIADAFREVFGGELELIYEISHNLVQKEWHPEFGEVWVHRKGATRAFPAAHPALAATVWEETGHPVLIPGSNKDWSYILRPSAGAVNSGFSVNHGAGRRMSRGEAIRSLNQREIDKEYQEAGVLVNTNGRVPLDEAAPCYKPSQEVIEAVVGAGLATVEYRLWPLASLKGEEVRKSRKDRAKKKKSGNHY
jgi:tRNA-splicing ligase RtcB (3'-phosphate/5'-hydroxy nucleic acid ligase)